MRLPRQERRTLRPRLLILLLAGAGIGTYGGLQIGRMIDQAGFGGSPPPPAEYRSEKPTEEDRQMGVALAAATGADEPSDCRTLAPRHREGCRVYLQGRREEVGVFGPVGPSAANDRRSETNAASAADWPAALD